MGQCGVVCLGDFHQVRVELRPDAERSNNCGACRGGVRSGQACVTGQCTPISTCIPTCNIDPDCQNTCAPPPPGTIYCCDMLVSACYLSPTGMCMGTSSSSSSGTTGT